VEVNADERAVNVTGRRRLSAARRERVRQARLSYRMARPLDASLLDDQPPGVQSWYVDMYEHSGQPPVLAADTAVHRIPLNTGHDIIVEMDCGDDVPASPLVPVINWDALSPAALNRLNGYDREDAENSGASLLVVEPVNLDAIWRDLGVAELFLSSVLAELHVKTDFMAVTEPAGWHLKGRARSAYSAHNRPVFENVGFRRFVGGTWLLTDWALLFEAREFYEGRFGFQPPLLGRR
jgi:hypothetical protein